MFFFEALPLTTWLVVIGFLVGLIVLNEVARINKWFGIALFIVLPAILTVLVWPNTAVEGSGAGTWFQWAKVYSSLAGAIGFMAIIYIPKLQKNKIALCFPPFILAINILEAVIRDFQLYNAYGFVDGYWTVGGPWNIVNGIAGILNILTICGWFGIIVNNKRKHFKSMVWPDMLWFWIIAYDLWNFAYVYNSVSDRAMYSGVVLLLACTIPAFLRGKGAWLQHRAQTLALMMMFTMTFPQFFTDSAFTVASTHNPTAHWLISGLALVFNVAVAVYQVYTIRKKRLNPLKDELYTDHKEYAKNLKANGFELTESGEKKLVE